MIKFLHLKDRAINLNDIIQVYKDNKTSDGDKIIIEFRPVDDCVGGVEYYPTDPSYDLLETFIEFGQTTH